jgi:hypothetical protein
VLLVGGGGKLVLISANAVSDDVTLAEHYVGKVLADACVCYGAGGSGAPELVLVDVEGDMDDYC